MGILKEMAKLRTHPRHRRYTDQRSDGDTERCRRGGYMALRGGVTQTNDPMGILKARSAITLASYTLGYTDQRSDGDTESPLAPPHPLHGK